VALATRAVHRERLCNRDASIGALRQEQIASDARIIEIDRALRAADTGEVQVTFNRGIGEVDASRELANIRFLQRRHFPAIHASLPGIEKQMDIAADLGMTHRQRWNSILFRNHGGRIWTGLDVHDGDFVVDDGVIQVYGT